MQTAPRPVVVRRLILAAGLAVVALLLVAGHAHAAEPDRANCPVGFVWIRMSGTGCVQEVVPPNGRISYTGRAICNDGWLGVFETRPTTDGKPAPGGGGAGFSYLLECITPEEAARRAAASGAPIATAAPAASAAPLEPGIPGSSGVAGVLADAGSLPDDGELGGIGLALGSIGLLVAASGIALGSPALGAGAPPAGGAAPLADAAPGGAGASETAEAEPAAELRAADPRTSELEALDDRIAAQMEAIAREADPSKWQLADVLEVVGDVAGPLSLIPGASIPAGIVSLIGSIFSGVAGQYSTEQIDEARRSLLEDLSFLRGRVASERDSIEAARSAPPQPPPGPPPDPETLRSLSDDGLEAERQRRTDASVDALDRSQRADEEVDRLTRLKAELDRRRAVLDGLIAAGRDAASGEPSATLPAVSVGAGAPAVGIASGDASTMAGFYARGAEEAAEAASWAKQAVGQRGIPNWLPQSGANAAQAGLGAVSAGANVLSLRDWGNAREAEAALGQIHDAKRTLQFLDGRVTDELERATARQGDARAALDAARSARHATAEEHFRRIGERGGGLR